MHSGKQILKSTSVISVFTGLSRLLGFFREILMAQFFGTTLARSAFAIAFRTPNLFRAVLGEGALNAAFVPVFTETMEKEGEDRAKRVASSLFIFMGAVLLAIVACGLLVLLHFKSYHLGESWDALIPLTSITLPYVLFICLAALCMGVFHSYGKFWVPAASQGLLNVVWIAVLLWVCPRFGSTPGEQIYAVAWGVLAAGALQLGFQAIFLKRLGFNPGLFFEWGGDRAKQFFKLMTPVVLSSGITTLNIYVSSLLAFSAGTWAPAALQYAERLIYLPLGIFAAALGSVLLPTFSRQASQNQGESLISTLNSSMRNICLVMTPLAAGLFALALPVVSLVFERGRFDEASTILTARAVLAYAPGLVAFSLYKVILPAFYGMQDTKTPVRVAIGSAILNLIMNIGAVLVLPDGYQHVGLAASNVLSSVFSCAVLLFVLNRRVGGLHLAKTGWSILSTLISGAIMVVACIRVLSFTVNTSWYIASGGGKWYQFAVLAIAGTAGLAVYLAARFTVNREETMDVFKSLLRRDKS